MRSGIHAKDYRLVIFEDLNTGDKILTRSTIRTEESAKWTDGIEYPIVKVHISSFSHPFYTGQEKLLDTEGRVDRFKAHQKAAAKAKQAKLESASQKTEPIDKPKDSEETAK